MQMQNDIAGCVPVNTNAWPAIPENPILANAYVPYQTYRDTLTPAQALLQGTVFQELVMPYRQSVNTGSLEQCLQADLMAVQFAAYDMALFLDTHPRDAQALSHYAQLVQAWKVLKDEYQKQYGPLTLMDAAQYSTDEWAWLNCPWPWMKG